MSQLPDFNHDNHFSVPEGYFDTIAQRVMDRIPANEVRMIPAVEKKKSPPRRLLWARIGVAAATVAAVFTLGMRFMSPDHTPSSPVASVSSATYTSDENLDAMADYIMVDDQDLYAYLSGE